MAGESMTIPLFRLLVIFLITLTAFSFCAVSSFAENEVTAEETMPVEQTEKRVWIEGKLPGSFKTEGAWIWDEAVSRTESASHTDEEGKNVHSFKTDSTVEINKDSDIIQYILLDPDKTPSGIMVKFLLSDDKEISVYWEGDEEVFSYTKEYITAWYMGLIPQAGEWVRLDIDCKELDIEKEELIGISFIVNNGKMWWGETIIKNQGEDNVKEKAQGQAEMARQESE